VTESQKRHYDLCVANGCSHPLAEMLALRQSPMSNTDREFLEGQHRQFEKCPRMGDWYKRQAESEGADVTGKVYLSGLAAYPGDPRAWVSGRHDVQKLCEERNWSCQGSVNVRAREVEPPPPVPLAKDIIEREVHAAVESAGEPLSERQVEDVREKVKDSMTPHWAK
jgi:hypothetical protein